MFFASRRRAFAAAVLTALALGAGAGCDEEAASPSHVHTPAPSGAALSFDGTSTLTLAPGATHALSITATPAAAYSVRFTLLGDALDAFLDQSNVTADGGGHAAVTLHAPSKAATFHVRATLVDEAGTAGPSAEIAVAVSADGFGVLSIQPTYLGHRQVDTWTATVVAGSSCAEVTPTLPEDPPGGLVASAPAGEAIAVSGAPVGPPLAVVVRAGHYAFGCTDASGLSSGGKLSVTVPVVDRPLDLSTAELSVKLSFAPDPDDYTALVADAAEALGEAFIPQGSKEGAVILNAMQAQVAASEVSDFTQQRIDGGWDAISTAHFAALDVPLRARCEAWAMAGMLLQDSSFVVKVSPGSGAGEGQVTVVRFGSMSAYAAGASASGMFAWSAEADDSVQLGGGITFQPTRFAGASCLEPAQADVPAATSASDALATLADCPGLAAELGSFGSCGTACVEGLCRSAIADRWSRAVGSSASAGKLGTLTVAAAASATAGDEAEPVSLSGHWLGKIDDGTQSATVTGEVDGSPAL